MQLTLELWEWRMVDGFRMYQYLVVKEIGLSDGLDMRGKWGGYLRHPGDVVLSFT